MPSYLVTSTADPLTPTDGTLRSAIEYANDNPSTTITFDASLAHQTITLTDDLPLILGDNTVIDGNTDGNPAHNVTVSGGGQFRAFFIGDAHQLAGQVMTHAQILNLTIADTLAQGGTGSGGGAGLGGAVFVSSNGALTLGNVTLQQNSAVGGDGTDTLLGGGGMGGNAGGVFNIPSSPDAFYDGLGGGGFGVGADGGATVVASTPNFLAGGATGAFYGDINQLNGASGGSLHGARGGAKGGGGAFFVQNGFFGGDWWEGSGGGVGGQDGPGGAGGFGGGGGGLFLATTDPDYSGISPGTLAGAGGFGGGGGSTVLNNNGGSPVGWNSTAAAGAAGGFGGGGGGWMSSGSGGSGGFGGGDGSDGIPYPDPAGHPPIALIDAGGGGAGMGGAVFVMGGGSLSLSGPVTVNGNTATGGSGGNPGSALGAGMFLNGSGTLVAFVPSTAADQTQTISDAIADQDGSGGALVANGVGGIGGSWGLSKTGAGTLVLGGLDNYTGATTVEAGTLVVNGSIAGSAVEVDAGATFGGNGTAGAVTVDAGGSFAPGDPSTMTVASLSLANGSNFDEEIGGTSPGTGGAGGYDQTVVQVGGTVVLGGATLNPSLVDGFIPSPGEAFTIIDNRTGNAVSGTFAQGTTLSQGGVTYSINYAGGDGNDVVLTAVQVAPVIGGTGNAVDFDEGQASPATIDSGITLIDPSGNDITSATVTISFGFQSGDTLAFNNGSATETFGDGAVITASQTGNTLTLTTTTGSATASDYQTSLKSVSFASTSDNPTNAGADPTRTVTWSAIDTGGLTSEAGATTTINVTAVNDAPTVLVTGTYSGTPNAAIAITGISFGDVDAGGGTEAATFSVTSGTLQLNAAGLLLGATGSSTTSVSLTATIATLNTFISDGDLSFSGTQNDTLTVTINDQGHTGTPGAQSASTSAPITVDAPPVLSDVPTTAGYVEQAAAVALSPAFGQAIAPLGQAGPEWQAVVPPLPSDVTIGAALSGLISVSVALWPLLVTVRVWLGPLGGWSSASNGTTRPSTAAGSTSPNQNSAFCPPNASIAASPTNRPSSTKSPPGNTTAMFTTPRQTGNSQPKLLVSNSSTCTLQSS